MFIHISLLDKIRFSNSNFYNFKTSLHTNILDFLFSHFFGKATTYLCKPTYRHLIIVMPNFLNFNILYSILSYFRIIPGLSAAKNGKLKEGDRVIAINGSSLEGLSADKVDDMIRNAPPIVQIMVSQTQFDLLETASQASSISLDAEGVEQLLAAGGLADVIPSMKHFLFSNLKVYYSRL